LIVLFSPVARDRRRRTAVHEITMPKLSDSMTEGKIVAWKVAVGQEVSEGDVLAEIESDKAVMELECFTDGTVAELLFPDEAEVKVGEVIARIAEGGESAPAAGKKKAAEKKGTPPKPAKKPPEPKKEAPAAEPPRLAGPPAPRPPKAPTKEEGLAGKARPVAATPQAAPVMPQAAAPVRPGERVRISPYARKLAEGAGVDYRQLKGSGPRGRIVAADVKAALAAAAPVVRSAGSPATRPSSPAAPLAAEELPAVEVNPDEADVTDAPYRLKTQARFVRAAGRLVPHFYVTAAVDVAELLAKKQEAKERFGATVTHLILFAAAKALGEHPEVCRTYDRDRVVAWKQINLGIAVDAKDGLTVVVLRDAGRMSLKQIVEKSGGLIEAARAGKVRPAERRNPTFTVSNLGMFGVEHFEPLPNPPSPLVLAVAAALDTPVVRDGAVVPGKVMKLTLCCDHRTIEGAPAARVLQTLKDLLEAPDTLMKGQ
jgi:pyruvate dehydrogenase E2 component (dihydrolipoamide acetyltransferase)